jgi:hypothetical protein
MAVSSHRFLNDSSIELSQRSSGSIIGATALAEGMPPLAGERKH